MALNEINVGARAGTYPALFPGGDFFIAQFRTPLRATVRFVPNPTPSAPSTYSYTFYDNMGGVVQTGIQVRQFTTTPLSPLYGQATTTFQPHGKFLFPGADAADNYYIWMDTGATMIISSVASGDKIIITNWSQEANRFVTVNATVGPSSFTAAFPGYYSFAYEALGTTVSQVGMVLNGTGDCFGHLPAPNLDTTSIAPFSSYRINAASLQISDVAAELQKGGKIVSAWIDGDQDWYNYVTTKSISTYGQLEDIDHAVRGAEHGAYSYLKCKHISDLAFKHGVTVDSGGNLSDCFWQIDDNSAFVVHRIEVQASGGPGPTSLAPGLDFLLKEDYALEFVTSSQLFSRAPVSTRFSDLNNALEMMMGMPVFFENPTHKSTLRKFAHTAYDNFRLHGSELVALLSRFFPAMAPFAPALGAMTTLLPEIAE